MAFYLRQQDPQTLTTAQQAAIKVEGNLTASGRLNQASSSRTKSEPKKNIINTTSSQNEMLIFLADAMKRMKANFAKQTETLRQQNQAMQNKIIHLESQAQ